MSQGSVWLISLLVFGNIFASLGDVVLKFFGDGQNTFQYLFLRQLMLVLILAPIWWRQQPANRRIGSIKVHWFRAVVSLVGGFSTLYAVVHLPLSTATIIFYAGPLITILLARLLFKEPLLLRRVIILIVGFSGVIVALKPEQINLAAFAALTTAAAVGLFNLSVRWLPKQVTATSTIFWTTACCLPLSLILALPNWQPLSKELLYLSAGTCGCYWIYHLICTHVYRHGDAGKIVVAEYSGLVFAFIFGWYWFNEKLTINIVIGVTIILGSLITHSAYERSKDALLNNKSS